MSELSKVKFRTTVVEVGAEARDFEEINMAILFGDEAPDALRSSCFIIQVQPVADSIVVGDQLVINETHYDITAVGGEVNMNLAQLGHIAIVFDGADKAELPGTLYVEAKPYPQIDVDSVIEIGQA
ncbi:MAG: PTS glucitol/sorbitol transporter subunit IIA [Lactobacillus sp.]|jgi:PTS system glucitol/sorbitol-specific IIA component|nr:PTS glucitol/sorbitol transporter subunit IIA [Lactobacillus sp.]MCI2032450.1 PTS glucitol/sorbitol transporter subunit IIA [Lactobacillus sp.]